jgi:hypothetical protein
MTIPRRSLDEAVSVAGGVKGKEREMTSAQIARAIQHILFKAAAKAVFE